MNRGDKEFMQMRKAIKPTEDCERHWIMCDCYGHAICIQRQYKTLVSMSYWFEHLCYEQMSIWERIKASVKVLRRKDLYADMVLLNKKEKNNLIEILKKI